MPYLNRPADPVGDKLYADHRAAGAKLAAYPRGPMGLTPDHIRATAEWKRDKAVADRAFAAIRAHNSRKGN